MVWRPAPLDVVAEAEDGDDWRIWLREKAADVFIKATFPLRRSDVRFFTHDGPRNGSCAECDRLYEQQRASILALTGEPADPYAVPMSRFVPGSPPREYHPIPPTRWSGPCGLLTLRTANLVVASVVDTLADSPEEDWKGPLVDDAIGVAFQVAEAVDVAGLEFVPQ